MKTIVNKDRRAVGCPIRSKVLKIESYLSLEDGGKEEVDVNMIMEDHLSSG